MNTSLPPEWRPAPPDRPALLGEGRRVGTSWRACPLSSSWDEAAARDDHPTLHSVARVGYQWNSTMRGGLLGRLFRRRAALVFSAEDYAAVTRAVPRGVLDRTLTHIALLRTTRGPRLGIRAAALLERVETAVTVEVERRRAELLRRLDLSQARG